MWTRRCLGVSPSWSPTRASLSSMPLDPAHLQLVTTQSTVQQVPTTRAGRVRLLLEQPDSPSSHSLLTRMENSPTKPDVFLYGSLIGQLLKRGEAKRALDFLQRMRQSSVTPNAVVYNSLLNYCANQGDSTLADSLLSRMRADQVYPDTLTCVALFKLYGRLQNADELHKIWSLLHSVPASVRQMDLGVWSYSLGLLQVNQFSQARDIVVQHLSASSGPHTSYHLANACGELILHCSKSRGPGWSSPEHRWDTAWGVYQELVVQHGLVPSTFVFNALLTVALDNFEMWGSKASALRALVSQVEHERIQRQKPRNPATCSLLASAGFSLGARADPPLLTNKGQVDLSSVAQVLGISAKDPVPKSAPYPLDDVPPRWISRISLVNVHLNCLAKQNKMEEVFQAFRKLQQDAILDSGLLPTLRTFHSLMFALSVRFRRAGENKSTTDVAGSRLLEMTRLALAPTTQPEEEVSEVEQKTADATDEELLAASRAEAQRLVDFVSAEMDKLQIRRDSRWYKYVLQMDSGLEPMDIWNAMLADGVQPDTDVFNAALFALSE